MRRLVFVWSLTLACWPGPLSDPGRPELSRSPSGIVPADAAVEVTWSAGARLLEAPSVRADDASIDVAHEVGEASVILRPRPRWPLGARVEVDLSGRVAMDGRTIEALPAIVFEVESSEELQIPAEVWLPPPGQRAPPNARWLAIATGQGVQELLLEDEGGDRVALGSARAEPGPKVFEVRRGGRCEGLCADARYRLEGDGVALGPRGEVRTGTAADRRAPRIMGLELDARPGHLAVRGRCDEPVRASGRWRSDRAEGALVPESPPGRVVRLRAAEVPAEGRPFEVEVEVEDLAGGVTSTRARGQMPAIPRVRISEVVTTPRSDWGDSLPNGAPFDAWPGDGAVTSADEWIELVHEGTQTVDLADADLQIRTLDGSPEVTAVLGAPALRIGDGEETSAWRPGAALVVRPRGAMAQRDLVVEVFAGAVLLDRLELGAAAGADHPGGAPPDLVHESLARSADGPLRWCRPTPGDPFPNLECWAP